MSIFQRVARQRIFSAAPSPLYRGLRAGAPHTSIMAQQSRKSSALPAGYKEDHSKGAMLRFEDSLPKLPIPTLEETAKRYLKSVHPLLSAAEYENTKNAVEAFVKPGAVGHTLQDRLTKRREDPSIKNWLTEWWNHSAYLAYRDPVVPYVSYFYSHRDDRKRRDPATRAAAISTAVLEFQKQVDGGSLEPEYMKKLPIAMSSFYYMFNCSRRPAKPADFPVKYNASENQFMVVIRKNSLFKVPTHVNGEQLSTKELEHQFRRIYQIADKGPAIGALTSENRDNWADAYERLIATSPANKASLETVEAASFVVCLDDASPVTLNERARQYWHGDGSNRWFDKPLQFIVNDNGSSGFCGEHSMMDGTPTQRINDTILSWIFGEKLDFGAPEVRSSLPDPSPIRFELAPENVADITTAQANHAAVIGKHELYVEAYQGYGKGLIKKFKCSPDAYIQMIIQLAYYKFYGKNRPTYESATTRRFQEGRTETCRSVSDESVAFCKAMQDPASNPAEQHKLFRAAVDAHLKYISDASDGKGVDRHLFGLKKALLPGEDVPEIFKDPVFSYSSSWFVSSSQLSSEFFNGYGWSQVTDDGYGIAYMINENSIQFNIVSKRLGCERMAFYLNEAAGDLRDMMTAEAKAGEKAKL